MTDPGKPGASTTDIPAGVLADHATLEPDDTFHFSCDPGVSCFRCCCSDVNIFLTPYDVLRLKDRLGISSGTFLDRYALVPIQKDMKTPAVLLKMNDDEDKTCPFLGDEGCTVYADRPWPCRMYPVGLASSRDTEDGWRGERVYFLMEEEACKGFDEAHDEWTVSEWVENQELESYDRWGEAFKELALHEFFEDGGVLPPERMEMFFTASYDLDRFRDFVFDSTLLDRFDVDDDLVHEMRRDDEALLRFAFLWLRFALFGEDTMRMKPSVMEAFKGKMERKMEKRMAEARAESRAKKKATAGATAEAPGGVTP